MKALTLTEPWATLMMLQEKRIETRDWKIPGAYLDVDIAIHAAKGRPKQAKLIERTEPFYTSLRPNGEYAYPDLNRTMVLCIVRFRWCQRTEDISPSFLSEKERAFGDYTPGRFGFFSEFVRRVEPVPAVGHLGFWDWIP